MDGKRVIGIDIGKQWLDVAREDVAEVERYANTTPMIAALVKTFNPARDIVVFERCGGYERELEAALAAAGVPWAVVHSAWVKAFRQVQGIKAKTDAIDARLLQGFGRDRLNAGRLRLGRTEDVVLDALMARQRQLKAARHAEQCRRETAAIAPARASIERMITQLETELAAIAAELSVHESTDSLLAFKEAVMCKRKGVAVATARARCFAELPEIGRLDRREIASLVGWRRASTSGRMEIRRGLVRGRAAVRGKPGKVILVAVMRKLLVRLNAAVRDALRLRPCARRQCSSLSHRSRRLIAAARAGGQGWPPGHRRRRREAALTAEHGAAQSAPSSMARQRTR